jgi:hypothetical protein
MTWQRNQHIKLPNQQSLIQSLQPSTKSKEPNSLSSFHSSNTAKFCFLLFFVFLSIQDMGISHLIQRSITKKLLFSKPLNILPSSWFLADTTAKSLHHSGGFNGAKINSLDGNDTTKISKSSYHVSSGGFMRGTVFWEPNKPLTMEEFHIPRPKAGEVLIKTKGDYLIS